MSVPNESPEVSELEALLNSREPAAVLESILAASPSGSTIVCSKHTKVLRISDYSTRILGRPRNIVEGLTLAAMEELCVTAVSDASGRPLSQDERPLIRALRGETVMGTEIWFGTHSGELIPCAGNAAPIRNSRGDLIGAISSYIDVRPYKALEQSLREAAAQREALYQELTHRVKNHLQILTALVEKHAKSSASTAMGELRGQLHALAAVYKSLDRAGVGQRIGARAFVEDVGRPYATDAVSVNVDVTPPDLTLASRQAGPLGMLVNEGLCNSYKHAFPNGRGTMQVSLRRRELGRLRLEIADDGKGLGPAEPGHVSHGLQLMRMFASQLRGELELSNRPQGGTVVVVDFPEDAG